MTVAEKRLRLFTGPLPADVKNYWNVPNLLTRDLPQKRGADWR